MKSILLIVTIFSCFGCIVSQDVANPVLHMGNHSDPNDVDALGNIFTSFEVKVLGFDNLAAGQDGAQALIDSGLMTPIMDPCNQVDNKCTSECEDYGDGLYQCYCGEGYTDNTAEAVEPSALTQTGFVCDDVDECDTGRPCGDGQDTCTNTIGSYVCTCLAGYTVSADQTSCEDFDECLNSTTNDCHVNATCINGNGTHTCECLSGFFGDGITCVDVDECLIPPTNETCGIRGTCRNTVGFYTCDCLAGYEVANETTAPTCADLDECATGVMCSDPDAECVNTEGSFDCVCPDGFSGIAGANCTDIDECALGTDDCHMNATCTNGHGNFTCECDAGFLGDGVNCNSATLSYCWRGQVTGDIAAIRASSTFLTSEFLSAFNLAFVFDYEPNGDNFFVRGFNITIEDTDPSILVISICFDEITVTPDQLQEVFTSRAPTQTVRGVNWAFADYVECADNFLGCSLDATCTNTNGSAVCACNENRFDSEAGSGGTPGIQCLEPIDFECIGTSANISLLTPFWATKFIDVNNVFVNQGCAGTPDADGMWYRFECDGDVSVNETHLISQFQVKDVVPPGSFSIFRLDVTFTCTQPAQQNISSNITAEDTFLDPGVDLDETAESSLRPLLFIDGFENAVVSGVKTGEKVCVKLDDPNIPADVSIMVEELHTSAPGSDTRFTLISGFCPVTFGGIEIETSGNGVCFTMHRPESSALLEVQLVVNLCQIDDCPTPSCSRKRRSLRSRRSEDSNKLQAVSFLIQIDPEDQCDLFCGDGACLTNFLSQKVCVCAQSTVKLDDGTCKATNVVGSNNYVASQSSVSNIIIIAVLACFFVALVIICGVVLYNKRRTPTQVYMSEKQAELRGVYSNPITVD